MPGDNLTAKLSGGRSCSTAQALAVAAEALAEPELSAELFCGLAHENSLTRMRVAYALAKGGQHKAGSAYAVQRPIHRAPGRPGQQPPLPRLSVADSA